MAEEFPTATFVSIDFKPLRPFDPHPRITFEVYDLYAGIAEPDASFDVVNARNCVTATKNFNFLLREMHRVLKPGGVLVLTEIPTQGFEWDDTSKILQSAPRRAHGIRLFRSALESQAIDLTVWEDLASRLKPTHPLWSERTVDPVVGIVETPSTSTTDLRGFRTVRERIRLIPTGPWHKDEVQRHIGSLARYIFTHTWQALLPLMIMMGIPEAEAQSTVDGILEEFADDELRGYMKSHRWSGQKI
ncbi:methyltransferase domain protein [Ceratobasidium sp. AG-Ba]|nr:methyltransferase domain protein [Ceratobasidium sp. AG-Ba]QRW10268.1 methyltransferase domain protein [Ceratobasidium sp. AG-Ba]